jgi:hypothetical protein
MTPPPAAVRLPLVACLLIVALVAATAGCGEDGTAAPDGATARPPEPKAESRPAAAAGCPQQLDAFVESLDALRRQLAVGLSYEQYLAKMKGLGAAYERIPVARLTIDCLGRGRPSEKALNEHIDAANAWGECLADAACTTATIEPVLQRKWQAASRYLSEAQ